MSALEQRELQELGLTPEQLKAKQQELASVTAPQTNGRKRRSDAGTKRIARVTKGLMRISLDIEPEDALSLHEWMLHQGYIDAAVEVTKQMGAYFDEIRLADELQGKR